MDSFGTLLAKHIQAKGLSRRAFSRLVKVSPAFVTQVITGKSLVPEARLDAWADALALDEPARSDFVIAGLLSACPKRLQALLVKHPAILKKLRAKKSP